MADYSFVLFGVTESGSGEILGFEVGEGSGRGGDGGGSGFRGLCAGGRSFGHFCLCPSLSFLLSRFQMAVCLSGPGIWCGSGFLVEGPG